MSEQLTLVRGWLLKADSDLAAARTILSTSGPYDTACFHCQQAMEKTLKGFLAFHKQAIPRTHDLEELAARCEELGPLLPVAELASVSDYAVQLRYDIEAWPTREETQEALMLAKAIRDLILGELPSETHP
jgi:HEPN domain-containing protein